MLLSITLFLYGIGAFYNFFCRFYYFLLHYSYMELELPWEVSDNIVGDVLHYSYMELELCKKVAATLRKSVLHYSYMELEHLSL